MEKRPLAFLEWKEFLEQFDESIHGEITKMIQKTGVDGIAMAGSLELHPDSYYKRTAMAFGPGCTYRLEDLDTSQHLGETPGQARYFQTFTTQQSYLSS